MVMILFPVMAGVQNFKKNDDSVKEAPAYCRSFLDGLYKTNGVGEGQIPFFDVLLCFVGFCKVL